MQYSDDNSTWTTAFSGVMSNDSTCGIITGTNRNDSNYGKHRYWRYVESAAIASHHPRVSRIDFITKSGARYNLTTYTADNCSDTGTYIIGTVAKDFGGTTWFDLSGNGRNGTLTYGPLYNTSNKGNIQYFDLILSNEDVVNAKPHPEMYWLAMSKFNILPEETLIIEDSPHGLLGATRSGASVLRVKNSEDLNYLSILDKCNEQRNMIIPKWQDRTLNVLIPMAGAGSRFQQAGYTFPKPLIEVRGKPMIQIVVENLNVDANFIFIAQREHRQKYNLDSMLQLITPGCRVVEVDSLTQGAACTTLLARDNINNDSPLIIANSDQFVEWNSNDFFYKMNEQNVDGGIVTFKSTYPKWSFAKIDESNFVTEVAEKRPISTLATVGIYFWKHGKDYVKYAEQMIEKNIRVNNEFYVCPVFNEAIADGKKFKTYNINKMWGLGTPEDLDIFLKNKHDFNFA